MKKITEDKIDTIVNLYSNGECMQSISNKLSVSVGKICEIIKKQGISRSNGGVYKSTYNSIIEDYVNGIPTTHIAKKYKISTKGVCNILDRFDIDRNNIYHNVNLVEDYWKNIDSYDKAYFLGFMITDGNVYGNQVSLELKIGSKHILETFKEKTKSDNPIKCTDRFAKFRLRRKEWADDLKQYGVIPNKTSTVRFIEICDDLMPHYIRGLIDGDGYISYKSKSIGFCGNKNTVTGLRDYLVKTLNVYNSKIRHTQTNLWEVSWCSHDDICRICEYMYTDKKDCYLFEKYNNYLKICGNTEVNS